jgi:hypothetical protein
MPPMHALMAASESIQITLRQVSLFGPCRDIPHISGDRFCDPAGLAV